MTTPSVVAQPDGIVLYGDRRFRCLRGSDVLRDGMYLGLSEGAEVFGVEVAEVFMSDVTREFSLSLYVPDVPLVVVEWLIEQARKSLPPETS